MGAVVRIIFYHALDYFLAFMSSGYFSWSKRSQMGVVSVDQ